MNIRQLVAFCTGQGILWSIAALGYFCTNGFPTALFGIAFSFFLLIGHMFCWAWLLGLLVLPFRLIGPRALCAAAAAGGSLVSCFLAADLVVFAQYRFHIGLSLLEMFFGPAGREIFVFSTGMWLLTAFGVVLIIGLETGLVYLAKRTHWSGRQIGLVFATWLVCFLLYNGLFAWGKFKMISSVVSQQKVLPFAYPVSANKRLEKWGFTPNQNPYALPQKGTLNYPLTPLACTPPQTQKNILVFMVDAWRADTLNAQVMPQLTAWTQRPGMHVFTNHLSGGNSTAGGVFSLFYALPHSYWEDFTAENRPPLVISRALQTGYEPGVFASSRLTSPAFHRNVFSAIPNLRLGSAGNSSWQRDVNAVEDFEHFLDTRSPQKPFFGFIFLDAPHGYSYPPNARKFTPAKELNYLLLTNDTDPTPYLNQYQNAVYFTDGLIARVLDGLQQRGLLENTVVVLTGDHGQELNDSRRNFWGHNGNFTDYQTKVPFVVYDASRPEQAVLSHRTTHHDVAPTLLTEVFGCTNPPADYALGKPLFDPAPRPFTVFAGHAEKAVRIGDEITVFNEFGNISRYDHLLQPPTAQPDPTLLKEGLKAFSRFYK